jgi:hypothetical protein
MQAEREFDQNLQIQLIQERENTARPKSHRRDAYQNTKITL